MGSSFPISLQILCVCGIEKMPSASDIEQNIVEWKTWVFITFCVELCAFIHLSTVSESIVSLASAARLAWLSENIVMVS